MDTDWILWAGTLGLEGNLEDRIRAAVAAGCTRVSMSPLDIARAEDEGRTASDLGKTIRASGLGIVLDPVLNWWPGPPTEGSRFSRFTATESLRMARDLGVASMTVIGPRDGQVRPDELVPAFAQVCDQAAEFDAAVHVEFIPMTTIPDLRSAWDIVSAADRDNGGILFDTWHFFRGDPDRRVLDEIPGSRIFAVQVDDALALPAGDLWADTRERLLPGDGAFDLVGILRDLDRHGALAWVGPEVISTRTATAAERDPVGAAQTAMSAVRRLVAEARAA